MSIHLESDDIKAPLVQMHMVFPCSYNLMELRVFEKVVSNEAGR